MKSKAFGLILVMISIVPAAIACGSGPKPVHYGPLVYPAPAAHAPVAVIKSASSAKSADRPVAKATLALAGGK
jgi:hypothetical protein